MRADDIAGEPAATLTQHASDRVGMASGGSGSGLQSAGSPSAAPGSFNIFIDPGEGLLANPAALEAFNRAAGQWETFIADPVTVTIDADLQDMASGSIIGSTSSVLLAGAYADVRNAMVEDSAGEPDDALNAALPTTGQFTALVPAGFGLDGNMAVTKANAKALNFDNRFGDLDDQFGVSDATITFNNQFSFDYDNRDGVGAGQVDLQTVAAHELGHALGFVSVVDQVDGLLSSGTTADIAPRAMDLYRFRDDEDGNDPSSTWEFTTFARSLTPASRDVTDYVLPALAGEGVEHLMSTGRIAGDGRQAAHWKDNGLTGDLIGIMDPTLAEQQIFPLTDADRRLFDLIGYEIVVPEPATLVLGSLGAVVALPWRRRWRAR